MERLGQKILNKFGLEDPRHHSSAPQLPGQRVVNTDERLLSSHPNGTYPRLAWLSNGSLLASFTAFEGRTHILRIARSTDGGQTFQDFAEVYREDRDVDNVFLLEVAPNTILAAFRNHDSGPNGFTWFRITVCRSTDGGRNWVYASQAAEKPAPNGVWEPFMRLGHQGEVQMTYSQEFAHDNQCTMLVRSFDQGSTWSQPQCLGGINEALRDGMTGIASTWDNGRPALVMVFETTRYGTFNIEALISYDDGNSWSHRHIVYCPPTGFSAGSPQIASLPNGALAAVFMTDENLQGQWPHNAAIKVVFSGPPNNGHIQWSKPTFVSPPVSRWPGIITMNERTFMAMYEHEGPRGKTITWHF